MKQVLGAGLLLMMAGIALAEEAVPTEVGVLEGSSITLHLHSFLTPEELTVLRLVTVNADALAVFVPSKDGFAALAVSPDDGFIRDGLPVASAVALGALPDAGTAQAEALAACEAKRVGAAACVIVLDISPQT
jgi:hypothetical protein